MFNFSFDFEGLERDFFLNLLIHRFGSVIFRNIILEREGQD